MIAANAANATRASRYHYRSAPKTPDPFSYMLRSTDSRRHATIAYVAPFLAFIGIMAVERMIPLPPQWLYLVRFLIVSTLIGALSWPYLSFRPSAPLASIAIGVAVFVIWVAPDVLFGDSYRHYWLFENSITGAAASSLAPHLKTNIAFMLLRSISSAIMIPILEELFWRGWMMRWLIDKDFLSVPLGKYVPSAFWIVALLFASEHGPYWEVRPVAILAITR
jgi:CAAX prenyl protease-like protein